MTTTTTIITRHRFKFQHAHTWARIYALKDDPNKVVSARHKLQRITLGSRLTQLLFLMMVYYFLFSNTLVEQYAVDAFGRAFGTLARLSQQHLGAPAWDKQQQAAHMT